MQDENKPQFLEMIFELRSTSRALLLIATSSLLASCSNARVSPSQLFSFDQLNQDLALRVKKNTDPEKRQVDWVVAVTTSQDPIGTIYRIGTTIPVTYKACKPVSLDAPLSRANYFPSSYVLTKEAAANLGLDQAFQALAKININLQASRGVTLGFQKVTQQVLADDEVAAITVTSACKQAIEGKEVLLVRGYVSAKRDFNATATGTIGVNIEAQKIGTLVVKPLGNTNTVKIQDEEAGGFIQILQRLAIPRSTSQGGETPSPLQPSARGNLFIQVDSSDTTSTANDIARLLAANSFKVASGIEKIETSRMPRVTQVRFFNDSDKASADLALKIVSVSRPNAVAVRVGIPAPVGQLELWLTKE